MDRQQVQRNPRTLVLAALVAAIYCVVTFALAPLSFGPLQLRLAGLLMPLCLLHPHFALGLALGTALSNIVSPYGLWDSMVMPLCVYITCRLVWHMRSVPALAILVLVTSMAYSIAIFPLGMGGSIPVYPTVAFLWVSLAMLYVPGYYVVAETLRPYIGLDKY